MSVDSDLPALSDLEFIGPFRAHAVVLRGRRVPYLSATPQPGGQIYLALDDRIAIELPVGTAEHVVPFIADCIAVAMGYAAFPDRAEDELKPRPEMPRLQSLSIVPDLDQ
ncbi:MAG TPA: hypothetical protein VME70_06055 [Mycobacteriales bacterium]|nr:hypothetical protein [Mycobacteriales bacterium]